MQAEGKQHGPASELRKHCVPLTPPDAWLLQPISTVMSILCPSLLPTLDSAFLLSRMLYFLLHRSISHLLLKRPLKKFPNHWGHNEETLHMLLFCTGQCGVDEMHVCPYAWKHIYMEVWSLHQESSLAAFYLTTEAVLTEPRT